MIASLTGEVIAAGQGWLIVEVAGIGYRIFVPPYLLTAVGSKVRLFCSHQVRQDSQALYGFASLVEWELFELLLSVSGIGPKSALSILGIGSADRIRVAILQGDPALFEAVPGIGKKAAAKIIVELKTKIGGSGSLLPVDHQTELVAALEALGYRSAEILPLLSQLPAEVDDLQAQIRWSLKQLAVRS